MASLSRDANGTKRLLVIAPDGKRRAIRLGKIPVRSAETIRVRVEHLVAAKIAGNAIDNETAAWLRDLDQRLREKLARAGLVDARRDPAEATSLEAFLDSYIAERSDTKPSTRTVYGHTRRNLIAYFGAEKPLGDITPGDADSWRLWLATHEKLADNTVRRRSGIAKQFFRAALRRKLVAENPFADLKAAIRPNMKRFHFVNREIADRVIAACPDAQWRLLFALSRYAGLRCPSEHLSLRWADVNWEAGRITVRSPKTEHHQGGESRVVPLFPELRPFLEEVFDLAQPGAEHVITRYRDTNANLRTQLLRIINRAGVKSWPKLFQNLRSTRETELAEQFPMHVVCAWLGNSQPVAMKHYLQVTEDHFERAAKAAHKAAQQTTETSRNEPQPIFGDGEKPPENGSLRRLAGTCTNVEWAILDSNQ